MKDILQTIFLSSVRCVGVESTGLLEEREIGFVWRVRSGPTVTNVQEDCLVNRESSSSTLFKSSTLISHVAHLASTVDTKQGILVWLTSGLHLSRIWLKPLSICFLEL
jgi:hypothetical protein